MTRLQGMPSSLRRLLASAILSLLVQWESQAASVKILPEAIQLTGKNSTQRLLLQEVEDHLVGRQLTQEVHWTVEPASVATVENHRLRPLANGRAVLRASYQDSTAEMEIEVRAHDGNFEWSFRNHVQPILAKFGCSAGACHGAAAGKNGFKLSLRGYDDQGDFIALTRHALGRRIIPQEPGRSLLLTKPAGLLPHKGGKRFAVDSLEFEVLSQWIANGFPGPAASDARIERIEINPGQVHLTPGDRQQVVVRAFFSDGRQEDVSQWAKFSSANESVVRVDEQGEVEVVGFGEGAVTAWYLSRIATATITAPFLSEDPPAVTVADASPNLIDRQVNQKLSQLRLPASPRSTDAQFFRRVHLDTLGILPTLEEVKRFLGDDREDKRARLIDSLLERPEYVDYWTYQWSDLLLVQSKNLGTPAMWSYYRWIRDQVARNTPWDEFVRQIVTSKGSNLENGAANFYVLHDDPRIMAETTTQAFLGMSINCAKCHNHPLEKWTNTQYFQMANLFARVRTKNGAANNERIVFAALNGEVVQPLTGKPQAPTPLDGAPIPADDLRDRREHLADWLVAPSNPYFGRAIVNRVWANFMGVGLVEDIDDLRVTNPASNEALLAGMARYLVEHDYDLKQLIRLILNSEAYQRSSQTSGMNQAESRFYSRYYPRRLMAEVMLDAFSHVTNVATPFQGYPAGWRALQLPDSNIDSYFLSSFGRANRAQTCACERTDEPSVAQVLHIANGETLNRKLAAPNNQIAQELKAGVLPHQIIENLYLRGLSRYPTPSEARQMKVLLDETPSEEIRAALEDVYWAVLSSREFLFNH